MVFEPLLWLKQSQTRMMGLQGRIPQRRGRIAFRALPGGSLFIDSITPLTSALLARLRFLRSMRCAAVAGYAALSAGGLKSEEPV